MEPVLSVSSFRSSRNVPLLHEYDRLSYPLHVLFIHTSTATSKNIYPIPSLVRLPFPVCKNLRAGDLKGSPTAHVIMGCGRL